MKYEPTIIIQGITLPELLAAIRKEVDEAIAAMNVEEKLLSPADACKLFQPPITKPTLNSWTKQGLIPDHRIGGRVYYKQSDIIASLATLKKYKQS